MSQSPTVLDAYVRRWDLERDGEPWTTRASCLLPVRHRGQAAVLKLCFEPEEQRGSAVMAWWDGDGAAPVIAYDGNAVLLERAMGPASLDAMARDGRDDEACTILCEVMARLHARRSAVPPTLVPLSRWFRDLDPAAARFGGVLTRCAATARDLLASPQDVVVLHGDVHHNNVLDFSARGWLAIDPKGLLGERGFDFANGFTNPDLVKPRPPVAVLPDRFQRRLAIVADAAALERRRLLKWIVAWTGLSAAWFLADDDRAEIDLRIAEMAIAELDR